MGGRLRENDPLAGVFGMERFRSAQLGPPMRHVGFCAKYSSSPKRELPQSRGANVKHYHFLGTKIYAAIST